MSDYWEKVFKKSEIDIQHSNNYDKFAFEAEDDEVDSGEPAEEEPEEEPEAEPEPEAEDAGGGDDLGGDDLGGDDTGDAGSGGGDTGDSSGGGGAAIKFDGTLINREFNSQKEIKIKFETLASEIQKIIDSYEEKGIKKRLQVVVNLKNLLSNIEKYLEEVFIQPSADMMLRYSLTVKRFEEITN